MKRHASPRAGQGPCFRRDGRAQLAGLLDNRTTGPIPGYEVDDVVSARAEMEAAGIQFIGPIRGGQPLNTWSHYYAPDGNGYFICQRGEQG